MSVNINTPEWRAVLPKAPCLKGDHEVKLEEYFEGYRILLGKGFERWKNLILPCDDYTFDYGGPLRCNRSESGECSLQGYPVGQKEGYPFKEYEKIVVWPAELSKDT